MLTAQPRAPTVASCSRCGCKPQRTRRSPGVESSAAPPRPRLPPSSRAPAHSPSPTAPSFSPQVLKLSLRGDTAAAAALLPLLCLPMDMHCKADPFSAMHREYRRPAPVSVPTPCSPSAARSPALRSHPRGHTGFSPVPPSVLFLLPSVSHAFSHWSAFCHSTLMVLPAFLSSLASHFPRLLPPAPPYLAGSITLGPGSSHPLPSQPLP